MVYDDTFNAEFYSRLTLFRMNLGLKLASGSEGGRKSNAKGSSVEFSDFREYIPGDDIRRIDWNAYARFDRLFVKLFMEEKEGIFRIFLDGSASMDTEGFSKAKIAKQVAAALSYCILDNSDRVILNILQGNACKTLRSITGRQGFSKVIDELSAVTFSGDNDLYTSLSRADIKSRGMSILISDLYTNNLEDILKLLAFKKQEIYLVQILSDEELNPTLSGTFELIDSETSRSAKITGNQTLLKEYQKTRDAFLDKTKSLCKKYGAKHVLISTSQSYEDVLRG